MTETTTAPSTAATEQGEIGPMVEAAVRVSPTTSIKTYDFGSGCHLRIGEFYGMNVLIKLGWDEPTRVDACDRLIAALTECRNWTPE